MKECVLGLNFVLQEDLHHLQVLVVDGHEESRSAERVHTVDVDSPIAVLEHPEDDSIKLYRTFDICVIICIDGNDNK